MASPLQTGKRSVDLGSAAVRGSRIRRDPPPVVKEKVVDTEERERWTMVIGVVAFALAIFAIILGWSSYSGWSPADYHVTVEG